VAIKWLGSKIGHSTPSRADIKNAWSCSSIPLYISSLGDKFTFLFVRLYKTAKIPWISIFSSVPCRFIVVTC
jgi:hypothetical protein